MSQNIYSIQLLNDLHNHFPELLYNIERFQNIQDVLSYIRSVAEISPYTIGQQLYNNHNPPLRANPASRQYGTHIPSYRPPPVAPAPRTPPFPPVASVFDGLYNTIPVNSTVPQAYVTTAVYEDNIPTSRVRIPANNTNTNVLISTLLGGLFGDILGTGAVGGGINLNNFLNERVNIFPTNEEIGNATTAFRALSSSRRYLCYLSR